jgi:hypothetical protein
MNFWKKNELNETYMTFFLESVKGLKEMCEIYWGP